MAANPHPFENLPPQRIVAAIEALGFWLPGEPFTLNSYENRVFLVHDDERRRWVAKFYRPDRWSDAQIREEHAFLAELAAATGTSAAARVCMSTRAFASRCSRTSWVRPRSLRTLPTCSPSVN